MQDQEWFIYALTDPRDKAIRYIGFTIDMQTRLYGHLTYAKRERTHKANWIKQLLALNLKPEMICLETGIGDGWQEAEKRWIAHYRNVGLRLTNMTDGGDGVPGAKRSPETCRKISEALKGKKKSPEAVAKFAAANRGKKASAETRRKMSEAHKGRPGTTKGTKASPETRALLSTVNKARRDAEFDEALKARGLTRESLLQLIQSGRSFYSLHKEHGISERRLSNFYKKARTP